MRGLESLAQCTPTNKAVILLKDNKKLICPNCDQAGVAPYTVPPNGKTALYFEYACEFCCIVLTRQQTQKANPGEDL